MQTGKLLILVAVAIALFAVLQAEAKKDKIDEEADKIEKEVDAEFKKLSKRAIDEEGGGGGGGHKKKKNRKGTTAAPDGAAAASSTGKPEGSKPSTTGKPDGGKPSTTTGKPAATTGKPVGSTTTTTSKPSSSDKPQDPINAAQKKQKEEREIIRKVFNETNNWLKWLEANGRRTLNPKAALATGSLADKVKALLLGKKSRYYNRVRTSQL